MGRGRNKAKQKKVARELKYNTYNVDFDALSRELREDLSPAEFADRDHHGEDHPADGDRHRTR